MQPAGATTAFGLWRYSFDYLKAARTLDEADSNAWVSSSVSYQCACQGIELAFKSCLRAHGQTLDELKKVGHSLVSCMAATTEIGMAPLSAVHVAAITQIDAYYKEHEFRYIVTGVKNYPNLEVLLAAGATTLYNVAPDVAKQTGEPSPLPRMRLDLSASLGLTPPA